VEEREKEAGLKIDPISMKEITILLKNKKRNRKRQSQYSFFFP